MRSASRRTSAIDSAGDGLRRRLMKRMTRSCVALVPGDQVLAADAVLQLLDDGIGLRAQRLVGGLAEAALDARQRDQVEQDDAQPPFLVEDAAQIGLDVAQDRGWPSQLIVRPRARKSNDAPAQQEQAARPPRPAPP